VNLLEVSCLLGRVKKVEVSRLGRKVVRYIASRATVKHFEDTSGIMQHLSLTLLTSRSVVLPISFTLAAVDFGSVDG